MLHGVWHFSFTVSNLDTSIAFYTKQLDFELIHTQEQFNEYTRRLVGYPDAHLRVAQLVVPGQPRGLSSHDLELVEYVSPRGVRGDPGICNPGAAHLAITVDDIHARYEKLTAAGARFSSPPNAITAGVNKGGFTCYFEDPDQIVLELVQPPAHRLTGSGR
ncbi:MAG: Glyoxalase/bleomycin resistance protein/dioxygenase [Actinomycetia bacterium]|nr:Glyoxalase/bleomycin resistance protein/dioxygenase [Actinomycetes bacterium]